MRPMLVVVVALGLVHTGGAQAKERTPEPGTYVGAHGRGTLEIRQSSGGEIPFQVHIAPTPAGKGEPSGGGCDIDGVLRYEEDRGGWAFDFKWWDADGEPGRPCFIDFGRSPTGVGVGFSPGSRMACAMVCEDETLLESATFLPDDGRCTEERIGEARKQYKRLFDKGQLRQAVGILAPLLRCGQALREQTEGWLRSDLALGYFKLGDRAKCKETLDDAPPLEGKVAAAVKHNLELCAQ